MPTYMCHPSKELLESRSGMEAGGGMGNGVAVSSIWHAGRQLTGTHAYQRGQPVLVREVRAEITDSIRMQGHSLFIY